MGTKIPQNCAPWKKKEVEVRVIADSTTDRNIDRFQNNAGSDAQKEITNTKRMRNKLEGKKEENKEETTELRCWLHTQ